MTDDEQTQADAHEPVKSNRLYPPLDATEKLMKSSTYGKDQNPDWEPPKPKMQSILAEADNLINGDRRREYGHPLENFTRVAEYWSAYLTTRSGPPRPLSAEDVAHMMIMLKIARGAQGYNRDTYVDVAGYAGCIEAIDKARRGEEL